MTKIHIQQNILAKLWGKTVIVTELGANVVIGDLDDRNGEALLGAIKGAGVFQKTDVTQWESLKSLFATARSKYGTIDVVLANAGMPEREPFLLQHQLDAAGELIEPDSRVIDVNLNGVLRSTSLIFQLANSVLT
ncbi:hypothetical protein LCI18_005999 [Fusarium solani-melongenae]|uniref:Uncharacterized protein n=1 Tax=Fusarium solani subsp. cucurbitae TaxID=2747967 RepID=A0ACD3Z1F3_FUSSC|nr:hypothetical protein LCI18_005999 [Fusarium solani-melongenae]